MATLLFGVSGQDQNWTTQIELSETDSVRTMGYLMSPASGYGTVTENVQTQEKNPVWSAGQKDPDDPPEFITVQAWVTRPATPEEAAQNFAKATLATLLNQTVAWEKSEAAKAAAETIPPITPVSG